MAHVSTGRLPSPEVVQGWLEDAHERFAGDRDGEVSRVYPALERAPADAFGIAVAATDGSVFTAGDAGSEFTIMSVSKPFVFALVCERIGADAVRDRVGVNGTGLPFNSLAAVESSPDGRTNPMVNAGAIATTALMPGSTSVEQWERVRVRRVSSRRTAR